MPGMGTGFPLERKYETLKSSSNLKKKGKFEKPKKT